MIVRNIFAVVQPAWEDNLGTNVKNEAIEEKEFQDVVIGLQNEVSGESNLKEIVLTDSSFHTTPSDNPREYRHPKPSGVVKSDMTNKGYTSVQCSDFTDPLENEKLCEGNKLKIKCAAETTFQNTKKTETKQKKRKVLKKSSQLTTQNPTMKRNKYKINTSQRSPELRKWGYLLASLKKMISSCKNLKEAT